MENYSKLLCVILVMYCMIGISTSSCPLIETNELEPLINDAVVSQGGEGIISVDVSEMNINCQAVGNLKDTYNYLTITARYQRSDNAIQVGQIFLFCQISGFLSSWSYTVFNLISDTNEQNALLAANTNTNCFMCSDPCDECDSACDQGLGFCTDSTNTSCCSFYDNDVCVSQCGTNKHSNESFDCVCNQFYNGADCTNCILQQSDCQNGGSVNLATCSCDCTTGYMAQTCNEDINECQTDDPCINSISCTNTNGSYVCDCMSGFTGMNCETNINDCMSDSCLHNSTCIDDVNNFTCVCTDGYEGLTCETNIDDCSPNPCMNGGTCTDDIDFYTCVCTDQYTGKDCDEDVNECENDPCNNGTCTNNNGGFVCTCDRGWTGLTCTMNIDDCSPNPCKNRGTCTDDIGDYTCECTDQYTGKNCSEDVNECEDDEPCLNGGTCGNSDGGFNCRCQGRWAGALCSTCVIDDCKVADCDGRDFECLECNEGYKPSLNGDECIPCTIPSCTSCSTSEVCSSCEEGLVTDRDGSACASPIPITSGELSIGIIFGIIIVLGVLIAIVITVIVVVAVVSLRIRAKKPIQHATKDPGDSRDPIVLTKISHL